MVEDNNQPLPENIPTMVEQQDSNPQSSLEVGGRKNKAYLNFNNEVSPTIQQLFEMFFQGVNCWNDCAGNMLTFACGQAMT